MKRIITSTCVVAALLLNACTAPTPEADLNAAVAVLGIVAVLPQINATERTWINAASAGLSCSAVVLAKSETTAQEALDIAVCFSKLPVISAADSIYISAGVGAVEVFIALFAPAPVPAAIQANATVKNWSPAKKQELVDSTKKKLDAIRK